MREILFGSLKNGGNITIGIINSPRNATLSLRELSIIN
jgi:hypothetical protein